MQNMVGFRPVYVEIWPKYISVFMLFLLFLRHIAGSVHVCLVCMLIQLLCRVILPVAVRGNPIRAAYPRHESEACDDMSEFFQMSMPLAVLRLRAGTSFAIWQYHICSAPGPK